MIIFVGVALFMFFLSAKSFYEYRVGTPTTATVTHCTTGKGSFCWGTWSIGGVSQSGRLPQASVGSNQNVRVSNGKAYAATQWREGLVLPGVLLLLSIGVFVLDRSRAGRLVGRP